MRRAIGTFVACSEKICDHPTSPTSTDPPTIAIRRLKDSYKSNIYLDSTGVADDLREALEKAGARSGKSGSRRAGPGRAVINLPMGDGRNTETSGTSILEILLQAAVSKATKTSKKTGGMTQVPQIPIVGWGGPSTNVLKKGTAPVALDLGDIIKTGIEGYVDYKKAKLSKGQKQKIRAVQPYIETALKAQNVGWFDDDSDSSNDDLSDRLGNAIFGEDKPRRRRRRRIATVSDIRDLAALQQVLGKGEAFKTWIATHPQY